MKSTIILVCSLVMLVSCDLQEDLKQFKKYYGETVCVPEKKEKGLECMSLIPDDIRKIALEVTGEEDYEGSSTKICNDKDVGKEVQKRLSEEADKLDDAFWSNMLDCLEKAKSG